MSEKLKYPRRKSRKIDGVSFKINNPSDDSSKKLRSINNKNTSIERIFKSALRRAHIKYRTDKKLNGKPDLIIYGHKAVVFCDGDFWHGYNFDQLKIKNNKKFWNAKIKRNIARDKEINDYYRSNGFTVFRFWEHEIKTKADACVNTIAKELDIERE